MAEVEPRTQETAAGATKPELAIVRGKLVEFAFWLNKQGYPDNVAKNRMKMLKRLVDVGADLWNPENVKEAIAKQKTWSDGYKMLMTYAYENFLKMENLTWSRPRYKQPETLPFIPTEAELDQLIAACGKRVGTFLQGLKDTGTDPGELAAAKWIDINKETRSINIRPVKNHNPRVLQISNEFLNRLELLPKKSERIFNQTILANCFSTQRKRAAKKLGNPRLLDICFTTFRHWKGTVEYHRTKDILYVKKILGHKNIKSTLKYIDLDTALFMKTDDKFTVRVASSVEEACALIETGFEYITGDYKDGGKIFRKRK